MNGLKELPQDRNSGRSQAAGALEAKFAWQFFEIPAQDSNSVGETEKAGIAADLADDAQNADGTELLEDIGIAEDGGLDRFRLIDGLMLPDGRKNGGDPGLREAHLAEDNRGLGAGVGDVVPAGEIFGILGTVTDKNAEIVQPGSGGDNLLVVRNIGADGPGQFDQAGLVPELIHRAGLGFHEMGEAIKSCGGHDTFVIFRREVCSGRITRRPGEFSSALATVPFL
jgi:hypothetical protein